MKKFTVMAFTMVMFLPCLVFAYHVLNNALPSGSFVFARWANIPVNFRIDAGTLAGGNGRPIVEDACAEWNAVPTAKTICGNLTTSSVDITESNFNDQISLTDGVNDVVFDETGEIITFFGVSPATTLGFCIPFTDANTGEITDVLLVLNGTIASTPSADLLSTTVHEFGHCWGLAHITIGGVNTAQSTPGLDDIDPSLIPTMYPFSIPVDDAFGRTLELDDKAGISVLYPQN